MEIDGRRMTWKLMQKYARVTDVQNLRHNDSSETEEESRVEEIMINFQNNNQNQESPYRERIFKNEQPKKRNYENNAYRNVNFRNENEIHSRPYRESNQGYKPCTFCKKPGHVWEKCRSRLGLCFQCGKPNHTKAQCHFNPTNKGRDRTESNTPIGSKEEWANRNSEKKPLN